MADEKQNQAINEACDAFFAEDGSVLHSVAATAGGAVGSLDFASVMAFLIQIANEIQNLWPVILSLFTHPTQENVDLFVARGDVKQAMVVSAINPATLVTVLSYVVQALQNAPALLAIIMRMFAKPAAPAA